jgi:5-carboxymethyl-2-hydroxymuconate isomerase
MVLMVTATAISIYGIKAEIVMVVTRALEISKYQSCPRSANYAWIGMNFNIEYSRSAFVKSKRIPVLMNWVMNTVIMIMVVRMLTVSRPMYSIILVFRVRRIMLNTEIKTVTEVPRSLPQATSL